MYAARKIARPRRRAGSQNGSPDDRFRQARAGDAAAGGEFAGKAKPHGGGKPPPYRARERGCATARSRQDKNCTGGLTGIGICDFVRNFRKAVGRGLDPAAAQLAGVVLVFAAQGPVACRGGVYAAREMARPRRRAGFQNGSPDERFRQAGNLRAAQNRAAGSRPRPTGRGNGNTAPRVRGKIKLHGRPAGRPYDRTESRFVGRAS